MRILMMVAWSAILISSAFESARSQQQPRTAFENVGCQLGTSMMTTAQLQEQLTRTQALLTDVQKQLEELKKPAAEK